MQETWVRFLAWKDPLKKGMATHSSILAWRIPWTEEPGGLQSTGSQRVGHDWATSFSLTIQAFVGKVMSLLFNMLSRLVTPFLPRSKCLSTSWLQLPSAVILESKKIVSHCFHCFPIYLPWSDGTDAMILVFWMLSFKPTFSLSSFTFIKRLFHSSSLSAIREWLKKVKVILQIWHSTMEQHQYEKL